MAACLWRGRLRLHGRLTPGIHHKCSRQGLAPAPAVQVSRADLTCDFGLTCVSQLQGVLHAPPRFSGGARNVTAVQFVQPPRSVSTGMRSSAFRVQVNRGSCLLCFHGARGACGLSSFRSPVTHTGHTPARHSATCTGVPAQQPCERDASAHSPSLPDISSSRPLLTAKLAPTSRPRPPAGARKVLGVWFLPRHFPTFQGVRAAYKRALCLNLTFFVSRLGMNIYHMGSAASTAAPHSRNSSTTPLWDLTWGQRTGKQ